MKAFFTLVLMLSVLVGPAQSSTKTENLILITFDGLRWQELFTGADSSLISDKDFVQEPESLTKSFWRANPEQRRQVLLPFFWDKISKEGQLYGYRDLGSKVNCSNNLWFSYPGYSEILCGFADDERINSNDKFNNPNVTVLEFINGQPGFSGSVAAFGSWDVFPFIINEQRSKVPVNAGFEESTGPGASDKEQFLNELQSQIPSPWATTRLDAFTYHYALEYMKRERPRLTYIAFGETDDFAHMGLYDAYLKSAQQTDDFIRKLWEYVQSQDQYKGKTTMIITTDHGRGTNPKQDWQHHGSKIAGTGQIWIAVLGPDTAPKGIVQDGNQYYQNQVAATVAKFLGFDYSNERPVGKPMVPAFSKK